MATVIMLCGLPGSGKTTLAHRIERERPALRLGEDEWFVRLYPGEDGHDDAKREAIKAVQWEIAERVLRLGRDVVLDWGFWGRSERDDLRARAAAIGARAELVYLDVPLDELVARIMARNLALPPDTYPVAEAEVREWATWFQAPTPDEFTDPPPTHQPGAHTP